MEKNKKSVDTEIENKTLKYSKKELISNDKYVKNRDILNVLLKENELYSFEEVDKIIEKFMKGRV